MRIAIAGAGGAGLTAAWLLEQDHDVVLYEEQERLGGHAHTVDVGVDGRILPVDAGFEFFGPGPPYAAFNRLLDALGVTRRTYAATMTLTHDGRTVALPPWRDGPVWGSLRPSALADLVRFRRFLAGIPAFLAEHDTTITIGEYLDRQSSAFSERFVLPLLLAFWCVEREEFRGFAAYNALYYLAGAAASGLRPPLQSSIEGGMRVYVSAIVRDLARASVRTGVGVRSLERGDGGFVVHDTDGGADVFDQVVLATNAPQALELIGHLDGFAPIARQLERFEYFDTTIAVHGDRRLMPDDLAAWSVVNVRSDGSRSHNTVWNGEPVFRSWITFDERMPEPLYARVTYRHGKVTPAYFDAQRQLKEWQGEGGLWLAGLYTHDADSHESAVQSAITVAEALAPTSTRLALLKQ